MALGTGKRVALGSLVAAVAAGTVIVLLERSPHVGGTVAVDEPSAAELQAFAGATVFFGHQSVGSNIIGGVEPLFLAAGETAPGVVETRGQVPSGDGFLAHAHVGTNGDPLGKFADFQALVDGELGGQVEVALLKLCYADVVAGTDVDEVFAAYVATMDGLQQRHPDLELVYTTVPLTTDRSWKAVLKSWVGIDDQMGPADNLARQRYNALVREKYGQSGRLFDIAAVESTMTGSPMVRDLGGETFYVLNPALSSDAGHLNEVGSQVAAAELVRVVSATLAAG
ncbi:MAG: hypothetical protein AAGC63_03065 [Propionicimonas sp.]|nr:hypothetical protein [Propionicimonas sp.]